MRLTIETIKSFGINPEVIALNADQLRLLGLPEILERGWVRGLIGKEVSAETVDLVRSLKGSRKRRKAALQGVRMNQAELF